MISTNHESTPFSNPAIEVEQIVLNRGHFQLDDISLAIPAGKLTAIVGPNGSGKSTLLRIMVRLLQPDHGMVKVQGRPATHYTRREWSRQITMLPQLKEALPQLTVRELVAYGRAPHKRRFQSLHSAEDQAIITQVLDWTGIARYSNRMFHTLSGGEQQRARIAMALAQQTPIVLLDEPTTFLDIAHQFEVMDMLHRINRETGLTIVMVLHELQQAAAYCHHMIALKNGRLAAQGEPLELLTDTFIQHVYGMNATIQYEGQYPVIVPVIPHHSGGISHDHRNEHFANHQR
ncbi:ABC transporter ATP-binding protein [Paenibacillus hunanensis]|uniref:ABC transporter ATP-binding protein n=1 Tax=Paenibacillus hunanensis TaxID=539262 RepID=UPI0020260E9B|nr:ABC transporter ATP-binding protein [Paenibacillus hunanensis]MCL9662408.1 ABC transporter ATP-binding protein [Paenibacillus hunanensis]